MTKRIVLAGILGGILMFLWEGVAHDALPLGEAGIRPLGNQQVVLASLKDNIKEQGLYFFPFPERNAGMSKEQQREAMRKAQEQWYSGPSGFMIFRPNGTQTSFAQLLVTQCLTDIVLMLLAAFLLSKATAATGFAARLVFVAMLGLIPTLAVEIPMWNWYGFPASYTMAQFVIHVVGFLLGGLVLAKLSGTRNQVPASS